MKKLILLAFIAIMLVGCKEENPHKYEGCLIIRKYDMPYYGFKVRLTPSLADSLRNDYHSFYTPIYEWNKFEVGDTIK